MSSSDYTLDSKCSCFGNLVFAGKQANGFVLFHCPFAITYVCNIYNKQLLDEVEHDIMNYQNRGLCSASADNTDTRF